MTRLKFAMAGLLAMAQAPVMATALVDGGFETKGAAPPVYSYCYDNLLQCAASPWVNLGSNTGVIKSGNASWGSVIADEGDYYGFIQTRGVLAQSFTATATGTGTASWIDTNRAGYGGLQSYDVSIFDGVTSFAIGSFTSAEGAWVARTSSVFALTNGATYSLRFTGLTDADSTAFIDTVSLATSNVPEPASWALLITGFGLTGAALRRRRAVIA